jgi:hypothetical protein
MPSANGWQSARILSTSGGDTCAASAIHRALFFPHSSSRSRVSTAREHDRGVGFLGARRDLLYPSVALYEFLLTMS